jgi:uncharacterized protein with NAD-binding domain and iron-sulfur cluster
VSARKRVAILGGGVAGMSAAHELAERGFEVEVFDRKAIPGGKARSLDYTGKPGGPVYDPPLPGEHGFRFFPRFYKHVVDTMARIPFGSESVAQNLVDTTRLEVARFDAAPFLLPARWPRQPDDIRVLLAVFAALVAGQIEVTTEEAMFFAEKMWCFVTSCEERRMVEYERVNWWDFIDAGARSEGYQKYFGGGITRSLVAAKARRASAKTIGDVFLQIVFDILTPGISTDRVLNGPTNDVWIKPWFAYLEARGVRYHLNADVRAVHCERGLVRSATVAVGGRLQRVEADYFIGAVPVERMSELLDSGLLAADPSLANLRPLTEYVEWMNGIQFYLREDVPLTPGHTIYIDSPWALTSISQPQFWRGVDFGKYAGGKVKGVLSVDVSDWDVAGLNGKEARHCTREEIAREVWAQIKRSVNGSGREVLTDDMLYDWFLDPDIEDFDRSTPGLKINVEPLLVNYVDTWRLRPEAVTRIPNFFLASDYVRTYTDLATMEAANEAARRAVNGIVRASRADVEPCGVWNLYEPEVFLPLRAYDRIRFRQGLPWDGQAMSIAESAEAMIARAAGPLGVGVDPRGGEARGALRRHVAGIVASAPIGGGKVTEASPDDPKVQAAAAARDSSDTGLQRLRIVG